MPKISMFAVEKPTNLPSLPRYAVIEHLNEPLEIRLDGASSNRLGLVSLYATGIYGSGETFVAELFPEPERDGLRGPRGA